MTRPLALVLAVLCPLFLDAAIRLGPERAVTPPGFGIASGAQLDVSMATSGEETLVAWIDNTRGRTGAYVAALSPDGQLIEGSQRWLAPGAFDVTITWTGSEYLAFWTSPLGLMASTLNRDRETVVEPRLVTTPVSAIGNVAWAGDVGMLIYIGDRAVEAAIIDRQGNVTRGDIAIPGHDARVASDGTSFFVFREVQEGSRLIIHSFFVTRYSTDGTPQDSAPEPLWVDRELLDPWDVAFDGQRFALVLSQRTSDTNTAMHRILVDAATLESTKLAPLNLGSARPVRVEWTGTQFLAFWPHGTSELRTLAFTADTDGEALTMLQKLHPILDADAVWNGHALVLGWTSRDPVSFETDILATTIANNVASEPITVSLAHRWQSLAAIASNGNESLVVWLDGSASNTTPRRLVGAHATGGVIDQTPQQYSDTPWHQQPVVVFTGTMYLLVYDEIVPGTATSRIALRRIDAQGRPVDASAIHIAHGHGFGAAWNGRHLLVAYHSGGDIEAVRITPSGRIFDSVPSKIVIGRSANDMSLATNGTDFLLTWNEGHDVHAAVISANADALVAPIDVATGPRNQSLPAVASDGRDYVVVYLHDHTLVAKKVLREGRLANTTAQDSGTFIADNPFSFTRPAIAATPTGYLVAWELELRDAAGELWLARLDRNAAVIESRAVLRSDLFMTQPTLTPRADGSLDLAYSSLVKDASYGATMRVFIRRVDESTSGRTRAVRH